MKPDMQRVDLQPQTVLFDAIARKDIATVHEIIVSHPELINQPIECTAEQEKQYDWNQWTPLQGALLMGAGFEIVEYFCENGALVTAHCITLCLEKQCSDTVEVIAYLLKKGANIAELLQDAIEDGDADTVLALLEILLEIGADVNENSDKPLMPLIANHYSDWQDESKCVRAIEMLLHAGVDINGQDWCTGETALIIACGYQNFKLARFLIRMGIRIDTISEEGWYNFEQAILCFDDEQCLALLGILFERNAWNKSSHQVSRLIKHATALSRNRIVGYLREKCEFAKN